MRGKGQAAELRGANLATQSLNRTLAGYLSSVWWLGTPVLEDSIGENLDVGMIVAFYMQIQRHNPGKKLLISYFINKQKRDR